MSDFEMVPFDDSRKVPMHRDEHGELWVTNAVLAELMELTPSNVRKYIGSHADELFEGVHYRFMDRAHGVPSGGARGATQDLLWSTRGGLRAAMIAKATPATIAVRNRLEDLGHADATGQPMVEVLPAPVNDDRALMMQMLKTMEAEANARVALDRRVETGLDRATRYAVYEQHQVRQLQEEMAELRQEFHREIAQLRRGRPSMTGPRSLEERVIARQFCEENGLPLGPDSNGFANALGKLARPIADAAGLEAERVSVMVNGARRSVHSWPRWVWLEALDKTDYSLSA